MLNIAIYIRSLSHVCFNFGESHDVISPHLLFLLRDCAENVISKNAKIWLIKEKNIESHDHILFGFDYEMIELDSPLYVVNETDTYHAVADKIGLSKSPMILLTDMNVCQGEDKLSLYSECLGKTKKIDGISDWLKVQRHFVEYYEYM